MIQFKKGEKQKKDYLIMSEEDRAAEIEKMKVKKKTTIMAWIITGILIIVPFLLAQIMAFLADV